LKGSAATTHLTRGGRYGKDSVANFLESTAAEKCEYWPTFVKVVNGCVMASFWLTVYIKFGDEIDQSLALPMHFWISGMLLRFEIGSAKTGLVQKWGQSEISHFLHHSEKFWDGLVKFLSRGFKLSLWRNLQCVSKNIPDIFSYNSRKHCRIFIIFGTHIMEKVGNQQML